MTIEAKLDRIIEILETKGDKWIGGLTETSSPPKTARKAKADSDGKAAAALTVTEQEPASASIPIPSAQSAAPVTAPVGNKDDMKKAVLAYRDATDQETALKLLTAVGAENFGAVKPEFFQQVTDAAVAALAAVKPVAAKVADPFGDDEEAAAVVLTLADVKKVVVKRQKDVSEAALLGVLTELGAVAPGAPGQPAGPSLKALDPSKFALAIEKFLGLPKTK